MTTLSGLGFALIAVSSFAPTAMAQSSDDREVLSDSADYLPLNSQVRVLTTAAGGGWKDGVVRQLTAEGCIMIAISAKDTPHPDAPGGIVWLPLSNVTSGLLANTLPSGTRVWRPLRKSHFPDQPLVACKELYSPAAGG